MKNPFGPFEPNRGALASHAFKINLIIGGFSVRQQLCFMDFLLAT